MERHALTKEQQEAIKTAREGDDSVIRALRSGRKQSKLVVFDLANKWLDNIGVVCFGLGGALLPYVAQLPITGIHDHKLWLWAGSVGLLGTGIYIFVRKKGLYESDDLTSQLFGIKEEYYFTRRRNAYIEFESGDNKALNRVMTSTYALQPVARDNIVQMDVSDKVSYANDFVLFALLSSFYCLAASAIPLRNTFLVPLYLFCALIYMLLLHFSSRRTAQCLVDKQVWATRLRMEETRMLQVTSGTLTRAEKTFSRLAGVAPHDQGAKDPRMSRT